jgi:ankyrin repeat protein
MPMPKATGAALSHAVLYGDLASVRRLLERGAPVNSQDESGDTVLH